MYVVILFIEGDVPEVFGSFDTFEVASRWAEANADTNYAVVRVQHFTSFPFTRGSDERGS